MFSYSVAEGSGDLYKTPTGSQVARRTVAFAPVDPAHARAATLHLLYTYGDANHDRLYFNDQLYGTDNIADWNTAERNNGPSVVTFQVLSDLAISNTVTISLGPEVPAPQETSLRPQLAVLTVTRPASIPDPVLGISNGGTLVWTTNSVGYSLESTTNLVAGDWAVLTNNPAVSDAQFTLPLDHSSAIRFYRLRKAN
jgi:hypothetical protein